MTGLMAESQSHGHVGRQASDLPTRAIFDNIIDIITHKVGHFPLISCPGWAISIAAFPLF
jgi:hypothetical protein